MFFFHFAHRHSKLFYSLRTQTELKMYFLQYFALCFCYLGAGALDFNKPLDNGTKI